MSGKCDAMCILKCLTGMSKASDQILAKKFSEALLFFSENKEVTEVSIPWGRSLSMSDLESFQKLPNLLRVHWLIIKDAFKRRKQGKKPVFGS